MTRQAAVRIVAMTALLETAPPAAAAPRSRPHRVGAGRDPAHTLYRHAAGLLATAQSLEAATQARGAEAATAPTLACVETSLAALATAVGRLRRHALERLPSRFCGDDLRRQRAEVTWELERLAGVLDQASFASGRALAAIKSVSDEPRAF